MGISKLSISYELATITERLSDSGCSFRLLFLFIKTMFEPKFVFHPWEYVGEELEARGRNQRNFADIIWISPSYLNMIIKGTKNLTPELCVKIGEAFGTSAEVRMNTQSAYSLVMAKKKTKQKEINDIHKKITQYGYEDTKTEQMSKNTIKERNLVCA